MPQTPLVMTYLACNARRLAEGVPKKLRDQIRFSETYQNDVYEYRHVRLPKDMKHLAKPTLMTEHGWRMLGVEQASDWEHYAIHRPEPHLLMFRRPLAAKKQEVEDQEIPGSATTSVCTQNVAGAQQGEADVGAD